MTWHDTFLAAFAELATLYEKTPALGARLVGDMQRPGYFACVADTDFLALAGTVTATGLFVAFRADATTVLAIAGGLFDE